MYTKKGTTVTAIVQARMGSTRLVGKTLLRVLEKPLLFFVLSRLKQARTLSNIWVATTTCLKDREIADYCENFSIPVFKGSEDNVLERFLETARKAGSDIIVRITADCPLIDPEIVDRAVVLFNNSNCDYLSNTLVRTYPRGLDVEVFSFEALERASLKSSKGEREHVTLRMVRNPAEFKLMNLENPIDYSAYRLTVDTQEDFRFVAKILEALYPVNPKFRLKDIISLLDIHPDWLSINSHIRQKALEE